MEIMSILHVNLCKYTKMENSVLHFINNLIE